MNKRMIGDIFIVVIDEIGEVTFAHDVMHPHIVEMSKKESAARCFAAVIELVSMCSTLVPTSKSQFYLQSALELLLASRDFLEERFIEQVEFSDESDEAAGKGRLLEGNTFRKRGK